MNQSSWRGTIGIAGLRLDVIVTGEGVERPAQRFAHFVVDDRGTSDVTLEIEIDRAHRPIEQPVSVRYPGCIGETRPDGTISYQRSGLRMSFDPAARRATAQACPNDPSLDLDEDPTALDAPLRLLVSYLLVEKRGFLLHSSGHGEDRGAVIFAGASGAGKTTTARKLDYANVLSDDQVAVRRVGDRWMAFATPFVGEYARRPMPRMSPLRRIALLRHGSSGVRVRAQHAAIAVTRLLSCVPWFVPRSPLAATLLSAVVDLIENVPVVELEIARDEPVAPLIESWLSC